MNSKSTNDKELVWHEIVVDPTVKPDRDAREARRVPGPGGHYVEYDDGRVFWIPEHADGSEIASVNPGKE